MDQSQPESSFFFSPARSPLCQCSFSNHRTTLEKHLDSHLENTYAETLVHLVSLLLVLAACTWVWVKNQTKAVQHFGNVWY